jgi:SAM-dependent methyltransferase
LPSKDLAGGGPICHSRTDFKFAIYYAITPDMDIATYAAEAEVEQTHWWFVVRRELFLREIVRLQIPKSAAILDVGTSTGTNLRMLTEAGYRNAVGTDFSDESVRWCAEKGLPPVHKGDVCALPFDDARFDFILATDIIEHVDDDVKAMSELARVLKPGGTILVTVPTFTSLWGLQDVLAHHKRRYRMGQLLNVVRGANLTASKSYYFNFLLFVPIWFARQVNKVLKPDVRSEADINTPLMNTVFKAIFRVDTMLAPSVHMPVGVSALVVARKA